MFFIKPFTGVENGHIYPTVFAVGDECPDELIDAAIDAGAINVDIPVPENHGQENSDAVDKHPDNAEHTSSQDSDSATQSSFDSTEVEADDKSDASKKPSPRKRK